MPNELLDFFQPQGSFFGRRENRIAPFGQPALQQEDDDENDLLSQFTKGGFERGGQFDQMFSQSVSPARELLANLFAGIISGTTGDKFVGVRQRKFQDYLKEQALAINEQKLLDANTRLQATIDSREKIAAAAQEITRQRNEDRSIFESGRLTDLARKYGLDTKKFELMEKRFNEIEKPVAEARIDQIAAATQKMELEIEYFGEPTDPVGRQALLMAEASMPLESNRPFKERSPEFKKKVAQEFIAIRKATQVAPVNFGQETFAAISEAKAKGFDLAGIPQRALSGTLTYMLNSGDTFLNKDQRGNVQKLTNATIAADKYFSLAREVIGSAEGLHARAKGLRRKVESIAGTNAKAKQLMEEREGLRSLYARTFGEVGNLNETEQKAAMNLATVDIGATDEEVELKEKRLKAIIAGQVQSITRGANMKFMGDTKGFASKEQIKRLAKRNGITEEAAELQVLKEGYIPLP